MNVLQYKKIDAFTDGKSSGNPAGVVFLDSGEILTEDQMQAIAKSQKGIVSEVAFCTPVPSGFTLRYFSAECEVDFCGHATIATMYDLISNVPGLKNLSSVMIKTNKGELPVYNDIAASDSVFITAPFPEYLPSACTTPTLAKYLGVSSEIIPENPEMINAGLKTLIVPIPSLAEITAIHPEQHGLENFCIRYGIDIILVYTSEVYTHANRYRTRVFAPKYGYLEDPATGSGNSAFGYYLLKKNLWDGELISLEQGPSLKHPNIVKLKADFSVSAPRILFGGNATIQYIKSIQV